jgi:hypothetical protein
MRASAEGAARKANWGTRKANWGTGQNSAYRRFVCMVLRPEAEGAVRTQLWGFNLVSTPGNRPAAATRPVGAPDRAQENWGHVTGGIGDRSKVGELGTSRRIEDRSE